MLPASYQTPAAAFLIAGGVLACFFGYRSFKVVLAVFGFLMGPWQHVFIGRPRADGGSQSSAASAAACCCGSSWVSLVGAGVGALLAQLIWTQIEATSSLRRVLFQAGAGATAKRTRDILATAFGG